jgi:ATP-dependent helicase HepA
MTGFLSAPISLERHQVEVVRRVLQDPVQRYLLADEVGLGKTIEAGVIIRQFVLDHLKTHRVLVIVPETLVGQWESELSDRCQLGERFGHKLMVVALEKLAETPREKLIAGMVVVDEAHQAVRGWEQPEDSKLRKRFEVLRSTDSDTRFYFYEVYESAAAVAEHKAQPHFQLWTNFKESGGCKSVSSKAGFPGSWAFPK